MASTKPITIHLGELGKTKPLPSEELIYGDDIRDFKETIQLIVRNNLDAIEKKDRLSVIHQPCFFVNGERGSGKSTVLRELQRALCSEERNKKEERMRLLAGIDPTELADTESFLVHILGRVQKLLQDYKHDNLVNEEQRRRLSSAYNCMQSMSRGLGLLMRRSDASDGEEDANYVVQESIAECVSSARLKEKFAELMECLSEIYGVSSWLVTVDDADMNFKKCRDVFETVRKYLFNPRMCFVFAGDLKLYIMVVRGMQMGHFGKMSLTHDIERREHIFSLLDSLEDQYIMKMFPVENRMNLESFAFVLAKNPQITCHKSGEVVRVKEYLRDSFRKAYIEYEWTHIYGYLSTFSMRSALQLLAYWMKHIKQGCEKDDVICLRKANLWHWSNGIARVVASRLIKHKVDVDRMGEPGLLGLIKSVLIHAKQINLGTVGARLVPWLGEETQQAVSFYLSAEVFRRVRSVSDIILYMLNLFPYLQKYGKDVSLDQKVFQHLNNTFSGQFGASCSSIVLSQGKDIRKPFACGVIPMNLSEYLSNSKMILRISAGVCLSSWISTAKEEDSEFAILRFFALYHSLCQCKYKEVNVLCLSVYNILFTIQRLFDLENDAQLEENVKEILFENEAFSLPITEKSETSLAGTKMRGIRSLSVRMMREFLEELSHNDMAKVVVDKIVDWVKRTKETKEDGGESVIYHCSADSLYRCWVNFWSRCTNITEEAKLYSVNKDDLASAGGLLYSYMNAFRESLQTYLAEGVGDSLDTCPLWACLMSEAWLNSAMYKDLCKLNIASVELSYDREKMEEALTSQLEQSRKTVVSRMEDRLSRLTKNAWDNFNRWCSQKIEDLKLQILTKKQSDKISRVFLVKSEKNGEAKNDFIMNQYEQDMGAIIARYRAAYFTMTQHIKDKFHRISVKVIQSEAEMVERRIRQKLKNVEREDKMTLVIISQLRHFEGNRSLILERVEMPMLRELEAEEQSLKDRFIHALNEWEKNVIADKIRQG